MPITKRKYTRKPRRKVARRPMGRRRGARVALPKRNTGNFASVTETYSGAAQAGVVYDFTTVLSGAITPRSIAVAVNYQYYRITRVEMRFKPLTDTYQSGGPSSLPYLYFQYDKSGVLQGTMNANNFEQIGTRAIRLDDKTINRAWKPSVLTAASQADGISQFKVSPWLPTLDPDNVYGFNSVKHYGSTFYISKMNASDATQYDIDIVLTVQFRKPMVLPAQGESQSLPIIKQGSTTAVDLSLNPHIVSVPT